MTVRYEKSGHLDGYPEGTKSPDEHALQLSKLILYKYMSSMDQRPRLHPAVSTVVLMYDMQRENWWCFSLAICQFGRT